MKLKIYLTLTILRLLKTSKTQANQKTSETLIKINFFVEMAIEKQKDALVSAVLQLESL